jgi:hypothetical protein
LYVFIPPVREGCNGTRLRNDDRGVGPRIGSCRGTVLGGDGDGTILGGDGDGDGDGDGGDGEGDDAEQAVHNTASSLDAVTAVKENAGKGTGDGDVQDALIAERKPQAPATQSERASRQKVH